MTGSIANATHHGPSAGGGRSARVSSSSCGDSVNRSHCSQLLSKVRMRASLFLLTPTARRLPPSVCPRTPASVAFPYECVCMCACACVCMCVCLRYCEYS
eukprot:GHVU01029857.1.p1 GENE.GHVU01029857.1~~GHVU01029857.1.p1  ORF type:complete len:100 (-),score=1.07 GHVU01029857.1:63-362(-)